MYVTKLKRGALLVTVCLAVSGLDWGGDQAAAQDAPRKLPALTVKQFNQVRELMKPLPGENLWNEVNWVRTLWEAQEKAAKEGKPIVVFATGGEPLGLC
jgi:hypothetical protein